MDRNQGNVTPFDEFDRIEMAPYDDILSTAKRERQARDYAAIDSGARTPQSMHLFGRKNAKKTIVEFRDVDFD